MTKLYILSAGSERTIPFVKEATIGGLIKEYLPQEATVGDNVEDLEAYLNREDEELAKDRSLEKLGVKPGDKITFSRCKKVEVSVQYNGQEYRHKYRPNQVVAKVQEDAVKHFHIPAADAANLELFPEGGTSSLDDGSYLVKYVTYPKCGLELCLAPSKTILG